VKEYKIKEIYADGYERIAKLEKMNSDENFIVHFLEYDEYLENGQESRKKRIGDIIKGYISIDLVTVNRKIDMGVMHKQVIKNSSHIEAVVEVSRIVDKYSVYVFSSVITAEVLVEFECEVDYKVGDRVFIEGSLEIKEFEK